MDVDSFPPRNWTVSPVWQCPGMSNRNVPNAKKKAGNGEGTWSHLPNGNIRVAISVKDATGKRVRKTLTVKGGSGEMGRKNQALRELKEAYPNGVIPDRGQTVAECLDEWSRYYLSEVTLATAENYRTMFDRHIRPSLGNVLITELTTRDVNEFLRAMASAPRGVDGRGRERVGYAKSTIKLAKKVLGMGLQHAKIEGRLSNNVARDASVPDAAERERRSLTPEELTEILAACDKDRLGAAWLVQFSLGLRPSEVRALAWSDIEADRLSIKFAQRREGGVLYPRDRLKTKSSLRVLALPPSILDALERRRIEQTAEAAYAGEAWNNAHDLIFTTESGQPIRPETYRRQLNKLLKGVTVIGTPIAHYTFRHSTGSFLEQEGVPLGGISDLMGHNDMTMMVKTYRHKTRPFVDGHVEAME